jgi:hypothetical protein
VCRRRMTRPQANLELTNFMQLGSPSTAVASTVCLSWS